MIAASKHRAPAVAKIWILSLSVAWAAQCEYGIAAPKASGLDSSFTASCVRAFHDSAGQESGTAANEICSCTAKESHHQGVSRKALLRETQRITKDPKYQIQDENLMNAFRWCTLESMRKADLDAQAHGPAGG